MLRKILAGLFISLFYVSAAHAGPQYIDSTGFAVSGYDVVSYFDLKQSAIGSVQASPLPGKASISTEYNGAKFAFSSEENLKRFQANPAGFAPAYDGHCAFGVAKGGKVPGNPKLWRIVDGKLYLNIKDTVVVQWEENIPGYIETAMVNWKSLADKSASKSKIPEFSSIAPLK